MGLEIYYSPEFADSLEAILTYFDERNGSDQYSKKLFKMVHEQIRLLAIFPEIGRLTDFPGVRIMYIDKYGIEYQIRETSILVIDFFSCQTITLEKSLLNEMGHIMGNEDLMTQTIKFVRSIRRKAKAEKAEFEYVPNAETRAAIEECESGKELETLDLANFKAYVKSL
jgi:toxin YoeB